MLLTHILAFSEGAGGLFDFNSTLPLMAIQFIFLIVMLTYIFYMPLQTLLEKRSQSIDNLFAGAFDNLIDEEFILSEYNKKLYETVNTCAIILDDTYRMNKAVQYSMIKNYRYDMETLIRKTSEEFQAGKILLLQELEGLTLKSELTILATKKATTELSKFLDFSSYARRGKILATKKATTELSKFWDSYYEED
jgi:F-type H+-transporting ATPase subunit b